MITDQQLQQFAEAGVVTIDTPLTAEQIAAASAAIDRLLPLRQPKEGQRPHYRASMTCSYYDPELLEIIQHPFFEDVAKRVLRTDAVHFYQTAITKSYPEPDAPWRFDQHTDIQYSLSAFHATPRRIVCSYFLWLTDVNERRAPMMFRPGSHLRLAEWRESDPERKSTSGRVQGTSMLQMPPLDYAEPVPILARAGQVSVLTTSTIHGASVNVDNEPRKVLVFTFTPSDVEIALPPDQAAQKVEYDRGLKQRLRPERQHIVAA